VEICLGQGRIAAKQQNRRGRGGLTTGQRPVNRNLVHSRTKEGNHRSRARARVKQAESRLCNWAKTRLVTPRWALRMSGRGNVENIEPGGICPARHHRWWTGGRFLVKCLAEGVYTGGPILGGLKVGQKAKVTTGHVSGPRLMKGGFRFIGPGGPEFTPKNWPDGKRARQTGISDQRSTSPNPENGNFKARNAGLMRWGIETGEMMMRDEG